jgi:calcium-dependent protein kinase
MWSLGVVMFVMLFGYPPFHAENDNEIFRLILKGFEPTVKKGYRAHFPQDIPCSDSAKDLLTKLLTSDTAKRLTAEEALAHPWMKGETASATPMLKDVLLNLKHFNAECKFKRGVLNLMANCLNEDEISNLKNLFNRIDENGDGKITVGELSKALEKAGTNITKYDTHTTSIPVAPHMHSC